MMKLFLKETNRAIIEKAEESFFFFLSFSPFFCLKVGNKNGGGDRCETLPEVSTTTIKAAGRA